MALGSCGDCWDNPCTCGSQGYTVVSNEKHSKQDIDYMVMLLDTLNITSTDEWQMVKNRLRVNDGTTEDDLINKRDIAFYMETLFKDFKVKYETKIHNSEIK